ncbi:lysoplasmalogenase [Aquimarina sp. 2201CG5-10]|uniref:lysoplasmalogenase n=1 Tax=Aquimarina callyspongiae TaxID=3098150 RepID=UPI002AB52553|nr:lysoplasmalogenase [Aquimarina sp. 2201CG5-10]MDY8134728.1 lysoplasmalogenase [Aquimarina sp. 2201CG5-10]
MICSSIEEYGSYRDITKPSVVGALIVFFLRYSRVLPKRTTLLMLLALVFSLSGDVLLLFTEQSHLFFIMGLLSFLIAHVMYVLVFLKKRNKTQKPGLFLAITLLYGLSLFYVLYPGLDQMLIPVIVYMVVILLMANTAFLRKGLVQKSSYNYVLVGALFFMLSDSLLALNMFYQPIMLSNIMIMTTYAIAQLLIVYGVLKQEING